jgi:hypothetical protein
VERRSWAGRCLQRRRAPRRAAARPRTGRGPLRRPRAPAPLPMVHRRGHIRGAGRPAGPRRGAGARARCARGRSGGRPAGAGHRSRLASRPHTIRSPRAPAYGVWGWGGRRGGREAREGRMTGGEGWKGAGLGAATRPSAAGGRGRRAGEPHLRARARDHAAALGAQDTFLHARRAAPRCLTPPAACWQSWRRRRTSRGTRAAAMRGAPRAGACTGGPGPRRARAGQ